MADYIDRNALLQAMNKKKCGPANQRYVEGWNDCLMRIRSMVSTAIGADTAPVSWTQADEALPPNGEYVLCWYEYFRYGEYNRMYQTFGIGYQFNGNWGGEVAQGQKAKVLAWTPLPKPPKMNGGAENG